MTAHGATLYLDRIDAVVFDTDGVVTDTARTHAAAWKRAFDEFLRQRTSTTGADLRVFDFRDDYLRFVDGRSRLDGVRSFLASRGIVLPENGGSTAPTTETVRSLAERKTGYFLDEIKRHGVPAYPSTVALLRELRRRRVRTAAVSASRNCERVLAAAHIGDLFDVRVDGVEMARLALPGKPDPALFQEAARRLEVRRDRCAVIEDSLAGVEAGNQGGFAVVVGVDRQGGLDGAMYERGAHVVVRDLADISLVGTRRDHNVAQA
jgi:beta-phosphoglucomutase family hydrolase